MMLARFLLVCVLVGFAAAQGVLDQNLRWRINGVRRMAYSFDPNYPMEARQTILSAIDRWNQVLGDCLPLQPAQAGDRDYVNVFNGGGCFSQIGRVGGSQGLSLSVGGNCVHRGIVLHEFLHAAGLIHTQKRPDRDEYITVHMENIVDSWQSQFTKESSGDVGKFTHYDIYSLMHYSRTHPSWSINNRPGFTSTFPNVDYSWIGYGTDFTPSDELAIRRMYNCRARQFSTLVDNNHSNNRNRTKERKPILCSNE